MKFRIVKNILKVIEEMEEVEILPIWSDQVDKKGHFIAEEINFQEEF